MGRGWEKGQGHKCTVMEGELTLGTKHVTEPIDVELYTRDQCNFY